MEKVQHHCICSECDHVARDVSVVAACGGCRLDFAFASDVDFWVGVVNVCAQNITDGAAKEFRTTLAWYFKSGGFMDCDRVGA